MGSDSSDIDLNARTECDARDQAMAWVLRLASGAATVADAEALQRWRRECPEHGKAFAEAKLMWETLGPAAEQVVRQTHAIRTPQPTASQPRLGRRAFLGGGLAAAASVAGAAYLGTKPPLGLWPSLQELRADYRTKTGERQQLALDDHISLLLNTRTSIGIDSATPGAHVIELISGETVVSASANNSLDIVAAAGRVTVEAARINIRRDDDAVHVTCLEGVARIACGNRSVLVPQGQRVGYDASGLRAPAAVDTGIVTAWERGQLIFRHEPFAHVVAELNRYRSGRIVLLNDRLGERDVVATFHLDRLDDAVSYLAQALNAHIRQLPGGWIALS